MLSQSAVSPVRVLLVDGHRLSAFLLFHLRQPKTEQGLLECLPCEAGSVGFQFGSFCLLRFPDEELFRQPAFLLS